MIAIELLAACQAIEFLRPLKTTAPLEEVYKAVRSVARPWDKDRYMSPDINAVHKLLKDEKIWSVVRTHMENYHLSQVRNPQALSTKRSHFVFFVVGYRDPSLQSDHVHLRRGEAEAARDGAEGDEAAEEEGERGSGLGGRWRHQQAT